MKNRRFAGAFKYACAGVKHTIKNERNFRFHLIAAVLAIGACIALRAEALELMAAVFAVFLVLCMELVNTAVEAAVDLFCGKNPHPLAKIAKDAAAGAVLLASVNALAVAGIIAWGALKG